MSKKTKLYHPKARKWAGDVTNSDRAALAADLLDRYRKKSGSDAEFALTDLLADLMHWASQNGEDFNAAQRWSFDHFHAEQHAPNREKVGK